MNKRKIMGAAFTAVAVFVSAIAVAQGNDRITFPESYKEGIHYATVERGSTREEIYTSREAIEAAKSGQALPSNTVITMEDYRNGELFRYVVMEKRDGWGERYEESIRNGDWEFQSFRPDRSINRSENVARCMGCHKPQEQSDHVFTLDRMRNATLSQTQSLLSGSAEISLAHHDMFDPDVVALLTRNLGLNDSNDN